MLDSIKNLGIKKTFGILFKEPWPISDIIGVKHQTYIETLAGHLESLTNKALKK